MLGFERLVNNQAHLKVEKARMRWVALYTILGLKQHN